MYLRPFLHLLWPLHFRSLLHPCLPLHLRFTSSPLHPRLSVISVLLLHPHRLPLHLPPICTFLGSPTNCRHRCLLCFWPFFNFSITVSDKAIRRQMSRRQVLICAYLNVCRPVLLAVLQVVLLPVQLAVLLTVLLLVLLNLLLHILLHVLLAVSAVGL